MCNARSNSNIENHVRYDAGQIKEQWVNLQTGEFFFIRYDGDLGYVNEAANLRLWYWRDSAVIDEDAPTIYAAGQKPAPVDAEHRVERGGAN